LDQKVKFTLVFLLVLLIANLAATAVRFVLYQRWVFRRNAPPVAVQPAADRADSRPVPSPLLQPEGTDS